MRLVFAGTPAFSVAALDALHTAGHDIVAAFTQPDRPAGRGQKLTASPVAERAAALGIATHKPESFKKDPAAIDTLRALAPDAMVVVAYGLILPRAVLDIPRLGCFNIHASLLPRWRGAAPIQRAILAGDAETGTTIMRMDAGLDTGPMLLREALPIGQHTAGSLHDALAAQGARLIVSALAAVEAGQQTETPQPAEGVTYAAKLDKNEARMDWTRPADALARHIRGYNPAPGAWSLLGDERLKLLMAAPEPAAAMLQPGTIAALRPDALVIATGDGWLAVQELQRPGGRAQGAHHLPKDWLGQRLQ
jgi:methionyl-tRNA formyltransferase